MDTIGEGCKGVEGGLVDGMEGGGEGRRGEEREEI